MIIKIINARTLISVVSTLIFLLLPSSFLLMSCSKDSTKPNTITLSGTVTLEGRTDYNGVKVSLYKPVQLDTALTNLNLRYPGVGIEINQRTEFYWREHTPEYQSTTNSSGNRSCCVIDII